MRKAHVFFGLTMAYASGLGQLHPLFVGFCRARSKPFEKSMFPPWTPPETPVQTAAKKNGNTTKRKWSHKGQT